MGDWELDRNLTILEYLPDCVSLRHSIELQIESGLKSLLTCRPHSQPLSQVSIHYSRILD
jgi:hypothetical protein